MFLALPLADQQHAGTDDLLVAESPLDSNSVLVYQTDPEGSPVMLTNDATPAAIADRYHYGPYGETTDGSSGNVFRYTGRRLDPETGLYYYRARYYSTAMGRCLQTDPIGGKDDLNLYAYTHGDPANGADPTGMSDDFWNRCSSNPTCFDAGVSQGSATDSNGGSTARPHWGLTINVGTSQSSGGDGSGSLEQGFKNFGIAIGAIASIPFDAGEDFFTGGAGVLANAITTAGFMAVRGTAGQTLGAELNQLSNNMAMRGINNNKKSNDIQALSKKRNQENAKQRSRPT